MNIRRSAEQGSPQNDSWVYAVSWLGAIFALCVIFVALAQNRYYAAIWLLPPLLIFSRNHRQIGCGSLVIRFLVAVVLCSILFFLAVLQDTEAWEANNREWIDSHPGEYDSINENLVAFFGFIPASFYSGLVVLISCGISCAMRRWRPSGRSR